MKILPWLMSLLVIPCMVLMGCEGGNTPTPAPRGGYPIPPQKEFFGVQGPFPDYGFMVIQRPEVWEALWGNQQVPDVDFSSQVALVAMLGREPTTCYDVRIVDVRSTDQGVVAYVQITTPAPGAPVEQVVTYPYHIVVIPKITLPVFCVLVNGTAIPPIVIYDAFQGVKSIAVEPQTVVIRDRLAWSRFWTDTFGNNMAAPEVDFAQFMAVGVLIGQEPTGGYAVNVTSIGQVDDRLVANYRVRAPQPGEVVPEGATSPYAIAIIPASPLPVTFNNVAPPPVVVVPTQ